MRILCSHEAVVRNDLMDILAAAATMCVEKEGMNPGIMEISLTFASKEEIHRLNKRYRGVDTHTDVLSFPFVEDFDQMGGAGEILLGDVVICLEQAMEQAIEYDHSFEREIVYLFVHSVYHLLGYDHMEEEDKEEMRGREEEIMSRLDLER